MYATHLNPWTTETQPLRHEAQHAPAASFALHVRANLCASQYAIASPASNAPEAYSGRKHAFIVTTSLLTAPHQPSHAWATAAARLHSSSVPRAARQCTGRWHRPLTSSPSPWAISPPRASPSPDIPFTSRTNMLGRTSTMMAPSNFWAESYVCYNVHSRLRDRSLYGRPTVPQLPLG